MPRTRATIDARLLPLATALALCALIGTTRGQSPPSPVNQDTISVDQVRDEMRAATESTALPADVQQKAIDVYKQALGELTLAENWQTKANEFRQARASAGKDLEDTKLQLSRPPVEAELPGQQVPLDELKQKLLEAEAARVAAHRQQQELDVENRYRSERLDQVRVLDADAKTRLDEVDKQLDAMPDAIDPKDIANRALRSLLLAKRTKIVAERTSYEEELPTYEATRDLMRARLDLAARRTNQAEKLERQMKDVVAERSKVDAELKARDARWAVLTAMPEVMPLARENEHLADLRNAPDGPAAKVEAIEREVTVLNALRTRVQTQFSHVRKLAELTDAVGQLLQRQRDELPDIRKHNANIRARQTEISDLKVRLLELETRRSELADIEPQAAAIIAGFSSMPPDDKRAEIESAVHDLLETRRDYLDALIADYNRYFNALVMELDRSERDLIRETRAYSDFINERIFWIRSSPMLSRDDVDRVWHASLWLTSIGHWQSVGETLWNDAVHAPYIALPALLGIVALVVAQPMLRRRIRRLGTELASSYSTSIVPTVRTLVISALIAAPGPAAMLLVAWRLSAGWEEPEFAKAVGFAMQVTAVAWFITELFRQVCRRRGLAELHFAWHETGLVRLRRNLHWLLFIGLPLTFVVAMIHAQESEFHNASLGRLTFMLGMGFLTFFAMRVMPKRCEPSADDVAAGRAWASSLYSIARLSATYMPLALAVLAALGYYYTSLQLMVRVQMTLWLLMGAFVARAFLQRWLLVARCRLAIRKARERRAAATIVASDTPVDGHVVAASEETDLSTIDVQTRRLVRGAFLLTVTVGCWACWVDVLPALKYLDQWQLWNYTDTAVTSTVAGETPTAPISVTRWVTLRDVLTSVLVVLMTVVAGRNLPGLIEIAWLQRLPFDAGGRYAITSVARYIITLAGIVFAFRAIGVGWNNVQWMAAAMTVGLGFGLQEIFANFISGLIILFERPMRIGDTVTVGGVSGTVSRIRSRATIITDGDRKELIVPNKEFITGQLVNWTLSDTVIRIGVRVIVAGGSDPALVTRLLLQSANEHPLVLRDPAPVALLSEFGENGMRFDLSVFVGSLDKIVPVKHELHMKIGERLHAANIEFGNQQMDLRMREIPAWLSTPTLRVASKQAAG